MRKTKEILRLKFEADLGNHKIGRALGISASTVWEALLRASAAGITWPLAEEMSEGELERRLYPSASEKVTKNPRLPDWQKVQAELHKKHVTLRLLWEEYKLLHPDGYEYSWFCQHFRCWQKDIDLVMRQEHKLGEKVFIDWAGDTLPVIDPNTGEIHPCYLFLGVLGASNYTYAEPTLSQNSATFLACHVHLFEFLKGVPALLVPDNAKTAVTSPSYYEPDLNPAYSALAEHYGCCVLPTRPARSRDKTCASDCSSFRRSNRNPWPRQAGCPGCPPLLLLACDYRRRQGSRPGCTTSCLAVARARPVWGGHTTGRAAQGSPDAHRAAALYHCRPGRGCGPPGPRP